MLVTTRHCPRSQYVSGLLQTLFVYKEMLAPWSEMRVNPGPNLLDEAWQVAGDL